MPGGLGAERAVFGTGAAFGVEDGAEPRAMSEVPKADCVGGGQQFRHLRGRRTEHIERVRGAQRRLESVVHH